jgi:hypothetical protein
MDFAAYIDVCNLYGSIPLKDIDGDTPSIFTVARPFFSEYKTDCELHALSDEDFEEIVRLCLISDTVLIGNNGYKQQSALAMGSNLATILALATILHERTRQQNFGNIERLCNFQAMLFASYDVIRISEVSPSMRKASY